MPLGTVQRPATPHTPGPRHRQRPAQAADSRLQPSCPQRAPDRAASPRGDRQDPAPAPSRPRTTGAGRPPSPAPGRPAPHSPSLGSRSAPRLRPGQRRPSTATGGRQRATGDSEPAAAAAHGDVTRPRTARPHPPSGGDPEGPPLGLIDSPVGRAAFSAEAERVLDAGCPCLPQLVLYWDPGVRREFEVQFPDGATHCGARTKQEGGQPTLE